VNGPYEDGVVSEVSLQVISKLNCPVAESAPAYYSNYAIMVTSVDSKKSVAVVGVRVKVLPVIES
jgi:hypothetical protein